MPILSTIRPGLYKDSVALMRIAEGLLARPGIRRATLMMATPANLEILAEAGLADAQAQRAAPNDLLIVIDADTDAIAASAAEEAQTQLVTRAPAAGGGVREIEPRTIAMGLERRGTAGEKAAARLAQISVPGAYAAAEALKALRADLDVFLFSDNVPIAEERAIKALARAKGRIVMGPDCGTAIIAGVPLGFANVVRPGSVGLVAASGTGLQEVTAQLHHLGAGVSHAIGTGGRDVSAEIGGISMLAGLDLLARDAATQVIAIVSKPPAPAVTDAVLAKLAAIGKPAVVLFLGADLPARGNVHPVKTLYEAAATAARLAGAAIPAAAPTPARPSIRFAPTQKYIRALLSGGTYCTEAQVIWRGKGISTWSNVPLDKSKQLADSRKSREHTAVDLGEDEFTVGRPHPMIDMTSRIDRLRDEAADPATAVVLLDIVLGYGSHDDPAGALAPAIMAARATATRAGRELAIVAFVCGTEEDPQRLSSQRESLAAAGAIVLDNSTAAATLAAELVSQR